MKMLFNSAYFVFIFYTYFFCPLKGQTNQIYENNQNWNPLTFVSNSDITTYNIKADTNSSNETNKFCSRITNCFECATANQCYWCNLTNTCENYNQTHCKIENRHFVTNVETSDLWFLNYYYMCDTIAKCGPNYFDLSSGNLNILLNQNLNKYDACFWQIKNQNQDNYTY